MGQSDLVADVARLRAELAATSAELTRVRAALAAATGIDERVDVERLPPVDERH